MDYQSDLNTLILDKLSKQDIILQKIYSSVEKTRKYFLLTFLISITTIILPLIGMAIATPILLKTMGSVYSP